MHTAQLVCQVCCLLSSTGTASTASIISALSFSLKLIIRAAENFLAIRADCTPSGVTSSAKSNGSKETPLSREYMSRPSVVTAAQARPGGDEYTLPFIKKYFIWKNSCGHFCQIYHIYNNDVLLTVMETFLLNVCSNIVNNIISQ